MHRQRLWWQLVFAYLWIPIVALLVIGAYGSHVVRQRYEDQRRADLLAQAQLFARQVGELFARGESAKVDRLCKEMDQATGTRLTVVLSSGQVLGDSRENPRDMDNHRDRPEIQTALAGSPGSDAHFSNTLQIDLLYVAVPLLEEDAVVAAVRASVPMTSLSETRREVGARVAVAGLLGAAFIAVVSLLVARRISRPLEAIRAGAERFAIGELGFRLPATGSEETRALAEALNRMAGQLDERIQTILRQQNEHEAMVSSMEEGVLAIDSRGTIISLNATCAHLLGGKPEQFKGRLVHEVIRKRDLLEFVKSALASEAPVDGDLRVFGPQDRWLSAHGAALYDAQRRKIGVLVVLHDVSRLRHLENVRRDFVANVSHELRTPITSIKGFVETLLDGALDDHDNALRFLRIMLRQADRLEAIVADLLTLSRIEKGAEEQWIELAPDAIAPVLKAAIETCEMKAADKGIRLELACPESLTGKINAPLLEQAVVNLVDNAIKYSGSDSVIEIRATEDEATVVIRVRDHGCGIESRHLPRLFERFYRVDKARSRELGGTGLGLAIVKHIVLAHRGSVSVESAVGAGSTFSLRLPAAAQEQANKPQMPTS